MKSTEIPHGEYTGEFNKSAGPKRVHGYVKLSFSPSNTFEFKSNVEWPSNNNYEEFVRHGCYSTLFGKLESLDKPPVLVILNEIRWDEISSCAKGFEYAAKEATKKALEDIGVFI